MRNSICVILLTTLLFSCCFGGGETCYIYRAWDGAYSREQISKEYDKKRKEFYDNESPEKKNLRKKNQQICDDLSEAIFNETKKNHPEKIINMSKLYVNCMKERGTPIY